MTVVLAVFGLPPCMVSPAPRCSPHDCGQLLVRSPPSVIPSRCMSYVDRNQPLTLRCDNVSHGGHIFPQAGLQAGLTGPRTRFAFGRGTGLLAGLLNLAITAVEVDHLPEINCCC